VGWKPEDEEDDGGRGGSRPITARKRRKFMRRKTRTTAKRSATTAGDWSAVALLAIGCFLVGRRHVADMRPPGAAAAGLWRLAIKWHASLKPPATTVMRRLSATAPDAPPPEPTPAMPALPQANQLRRLLAPVVQRYLVKFEYDGRNFSGAAAQRSLPDVPTVQGVIEVRLSVVVDL